jgi:hypothetical protein
MGRWRWLVALGLVTGCHDFTEMVVKIDSAELMVPGDLKRLRVVVADPDVNGARAS